MNNQEKLKVLADEIIPLLKQAKDIASKHRIPLISLASADEGAETPVNVLISLPTDLNKIGSDRMRAMAALADPEVDPGILMLVSELALAGAMVVGMADISISQDEENENPDQAKYTTPCNCLRCQGVRSAKAGMN